MKKSRLLSCTLIFTFASSAQADFYQVYAQNNLNYWIQPQIYDYVKPGVSSSGKTMQSSETYTTSSLEFKSLESVSLKVTDIMLTSLGKQVNKTVPQLKNEIAAQKDQRLPPALIAQFLKKKNYPVNNTASYFNVFLSISYNTLTGKPLKSSRERVMYGKVIEIMADGFGKVKDDQKQFIAEYFAWMAQMQFYQNQRNPEAAKKSALAVLQEFGLNQAKLEKLATQ